jgi:DNA adenine methylase
MESKASVSQKENNQEYKPLPVTYSIPSLIKWTGSKRSQATEIVRFMPPYKRYIEPFLGSGSILYAAAVPGSIASDIYGPLIDLWCVIKENPELVIDNYREQWINLSNELDGLDRSNLPKNQALPSYYYHVRERFNKNKNPLDLNFLMRTCVNGIVRFNDKGEFNNSFHLSRRGMDPVRFEKVVTAWKDVVQKVEFVCQDYSETLNHAVCGDFVYLDPPYAGNKQRYALDLDIGRFFEELEKLNNRGVKWALSFDGRRGGQNLLYDVPKSIYKRHQLIFSGSSAVNKVLNGPVEAVEESLYLNY